MARAGRKRKNVPRQPNGQPSRRVAHIAAQKEMTEEEAKFVVIKARMRHTGLPEHLVDLADAGKPNAGTLHGVLRLSGEITAAEWQAAEWYLAKRAAWLRSILARGEGVISGGNVHGMDDQDAYIEWCRSAAGEWEEVAECLREASILARSPVLAAFDVILIRDQRVDHMVNDLKAGLNAIYKRFIMVQKKAASARWNPIASKFNNNKVLVPAPGASPITPFQESLDLQISN